MAKVNDRVKFQDGEGIVEEVGTSRTGEKVLIVKSGKDRYKLRETDVEVIEEGVVAITEEDFDKAVLSVLDPENYDKLDKSSRTIVTVTGGMICELLRRELFT